MEKVTTEEGNYTEYWPRRQKAGKRKRVSLTSCPGLSPEIMDAKFMD